MKKYLFLSIIISLVFLGSCTEPAAMEDDFVDFTPAVPPAGWPDSSTGLTDSSILTQSSGFTVTTPGTTIENLDINGALHIEADNVTVQNCRLRGGAYHALQIHGCTGVIIRNNEIGREAGDWPNGMKGITIGGDSSASATIEDNYIRYVDDGIFIGSFTQGITFTVTIQNNYITYVHSNDYVPGDSVHDHKGDGIEVLGQLTDSSIIHNSINVPTSQTSCILLEAHWAALDNVTVDGNWLDGAGYSLYTIDREYLFTNVSVINNRLGRTYHYGAWTHTAGMDLIALSGNVWNDTGLPVENMNW